MTFSDNDSPRAAMTSPPTKLARHDAANASAFARMPRATAKEKLHAFLQERPAGADAAELVGLLFKGAGSDPELGARLIHGLIGGDPNFVSRRQRRDVVAAPKRRPAHPARRRPLRRGRSRNHRRPRRAPARLSKSARAAWRASASPATFATLVRPRMPIPRFITGLTSITNEMVRDGAADRGCAAGVSRFSRRRRDGRA